MTLFVVGINHRTAPLALREQLAIPPRDVPAALMALRTTGHIEEAVVLSTCNRVELYGASADPSTAARDVIATSGATARASVPSSSFHPAT